MADFCLLILEGAIAQLGERLLCKQEVVGSIPSGSTSRARASSAENEFRARRQAARLVAGAGYLTS